MDELVHLGSGLVVWSANPTLIGRPTCRTNKNTELLLDKYSRSRKKGLWFIYPTQPTEVPRTACQTPQSNAEAERSAGQPRDREGVDGPLPHLTSVAVDL